MNTDSGEYIFELNSHVDSFLGVFDRRTGGENRTDAGFDCAVNDVASFFWGVLVNVGVCINEHVQEILRQELMAVGREKAGSRVGCLLIVL